MAMHDASFYSMDIERLKESSDDICTWLLGIYLRSIRLMNENELMIVQIQKKKKKHNYPMHEIEVTYFVTENEILH